MATKKRAIKPEDFVLLHTVSDPHVSLDGKLVAYSVTTVDREADETHIAVHVARLDERTSPRRFTQGKRDHSPRWSPDGKYLAFVSNRNDKNQLFIAPLDGGEARQITKSKHGMAQPAWSPDGKRIAYVQRTGEYKEPKERKGAEKNAPRVIRDLRYRLDGVGFFDNRRFHVFTVDVESGKETQITSGDWNDDSPSWSPDGKSIAFVSDRERERWQRLWRADVWTVPSKGGRARKITRSLGASAQPRFSPDGRSIAYVGHEHGEAGSAKNSHLFVSPAEGGRAPRSLSAPLDRTAGAAGAAFAWSRDGRSVLFLAVDHGAVSLYRAGAANGSVSKLVGGDRQIDAIDLTPDGRRVVFTAAWASDPSELYIAPLANGRARMLSHANAELRKAVDFTPTRRVTYEAPDGLDIEAFVLYPPSFRKSRRYPLVLYVHGGPHAYHPAAAGAASSFLAYQALAAAGYVVLLPNPRGSQGYGEEFAHAVVGDWGGKDFADLLAGVDLLVRRGVADPRRLYVGGGSYGGFMSSWAVGQTDIFRAAVVAAPVSDHVSMFGMTDIPLFSIYEHGGTPWEAEEMLRERSPVTYLPHVKAPVLLLHWEGDLRCPIEQSEEIFQGLKILGKPVEFVRYPGGFHAVRTPSQDVDRMRRIIAWFDRHTPKRKSGRRAASRNGRAIGRNGTRPAPKKAGRRRAKAAAR
jgi:dipeptidyl aminopeptidase/acylaminoacyl peptidase